MNARAGLLFVLVLLIGGLAWWILDGDGESDLLEEASAPEAEEEPAPSAAPEPDESDRERAEATPMESDSDHDHGHAAEGFGNLIEAVGDVLNLEPKRTFRFSGQVLHDGVPVSGAQVTAREGVQWGSNGEQLEQLVIECDTAGRFSGEFEVRRHYNLVLRASAYQLLPKDELVVSNELEGEADNLELELFPATEFHGTVSLESGALVEGAEVSLHLTNHWSRNRAGDTLQTTYVGVSYEDQTTELDGQFAWQVPVGEYQVEAKHEEYGRAFKWKVSTEECPLDLRLAEEIEDPKSRIVGTVYGPDGKPKVGATVLFATSGPRVTTDDNGEFVLDDVEKHWALDPEVLAWAKGCTPVSIAIPELLEVVGPLRIDLQRGGVLAGVVVDEDDQPAAFRTVFLLGLREFGDGQIPVRNELSIFGDEDEVRTDAEGRFRFESVPPVQLTVAVGDLYSPEATVLAFPDNDQLVLRLGELQGPRVTVMGRVTDAASSAPLQGVKVQVNKVSRSGSGGWSASSVRDLLTDENGMYRGEGLPPGEYYFEAVQDGYARGKTAPVEEKAGEKTLDFRLYPERTVRIVVKNADGTAANGVSVTIKDSTGQALMIWSGDGSGRTPARTDDKGVLLAHKMPGGPATVEIRDNEGETITEAVDWGGEGPHELLVELDG